MRILVYCASEDEDQCGKLLKRVSGAGIEVDLIALGRPGRGRKVAPQMVYFDADAAELDRIVELGAKAALRSPWGVIDRNGRISDPAGLFHAGASDYLGPGLLRGTKVLDQGRLTRVAEFQGEGQSPRTEPLSGCGEGTKAASPRHFPGWNKLKVETCYPFTFCYVAIADQQDLLARLGEKRIDALRDEFSAFIAAWAEELGGRLWIRDATSNLLLFPSGEGRRENPAICAFKLLMDRVLLGYERFRLAHPMSFRFAFHVGDAPWRLPGKTGTVVSEHVNFIYHFGMKAVPDGTIGVSETAAELLHPGLRELFLEGKPFEGRRTWYSRRIR